MSVSGLPFDDFRALISNLPDANAEMAAIAGERADALYDHLIPGVGDEDAVVEKKLVQWLAAWSGKSPAVQRPLLAVFAGSHTSGSLVDGEETLEAVTRLAAGGSPANQLCALHDIGLKAFDLALQFPVADIRTGDALDEKSCAGTIGFGMEAVAGGIDLLGLAAFGRGDNIANAVIDAIYAAGRENAADFHGIERGSEAHDAIDQSVARLKARFEKRFDALELLRCAGGREHAALIGAILAARVEQVPVVISGSTALSCARLLHRLAPDSIAHCIVAGGGSAAKRVSADLGLTHILSEMAAYRDGAACAAAIAYLKGLAAVHSQTVLGAA